MPLFDWQTAVVVAVVGAAIMFIARAIRRTLGSRRSSAGCGTCGSCPTQAATPSVTSRPMVPIEALKTPGK